MNSLSLPLALRKKVRWISVLLMHFTCFEQFQSEKSEQRKTLRIFHGKILFMQSRFPHAKKHDSKKCIALVWWCLAYSFFAMSYACAFNEDTFYDHGNNNSNERSRYLKLLFDVSRSTFHYSRNDHNLMT